MDGYTRKNFKRICYPLPKEKTGHRLRYIPNKTTMGFRLTCSCGWSWRSGWVGNRAGHDYALVDGRREFETHLKTTRKGHTT